MGRKVFTEFKRLKDFPKTRPKLDTRESSFLLISGTRNYGELRVAGNAHKPLVTFYFNLRSYLVGIYGNFYLIYAHLTRIYWYLRP